MEGRLSFQIQPSSHSASFPRASTGYNCNGEREQHLSCLPSKRPQLSGSSAQLLQPRVIRLRLLEDGDVGVDVLPEREEILVGCPCLGPISRQSERSAKLQASRCAYGIADHGPAVSENSPEFRSRFGVRSDKVRPAR